MGVHLHSYLTLDVVLQGSLKALHAIQAVVLEHLGALVQELI